MDWHVPLLAIAVTLAGTLGLWAWRLDRQRKIIEHRIAIVTAREAAFIAILQRLSAARTLEEILLETVRAIERIIPDCIGSIQLIENGTIRNGAAPGLPEFYNKLVDGLPIGEGMGSCGSAAALRKPVIVADVFDHPYWAPYKEIARQAGFAACWSYPVMQPDGTVIFSDRNLTGQCAPMGEGPPLLRVPSVAPGPAEEAKPEPAKPAPPEPAEVPTPGRGYRTGQFLWYAKRFPDAVKAVGTLYGDVAASKSWARNSPQVNDTSGEDS